MDSDVEFSFGFQELDAFLNDGRPFDPSLLQDIVTTTNSNTEGQSRTDLPPFFVPGTDDLAASFIRNGIPGFTSNDELGSVVYSHGDDSHLLNYPPALNQSIDAYTYWCNALEVLRGLVAEARPALARIAIDSADAQSQLNSLRHPSPLQTGGTLTTVLATMSHVMHMALNQVHPVTEIPPRNKSGSQDDNGCYPGDTYEPRVAEPDEPNTDYFRSEKRVRQSTLGNKDVCSTPLSLSQLLQTLVMNLAEVEPMQLKIVLQPKSLWKHRSLNCLANGTCPELQGNAGEQRKHVTIKWEAEAGHIEKQLFVFIQLLDCENKPNQSKILLPHNARIQSRCNPEQQNDRVKKRKRWAKKRFTVKDIDIPDTGGFDEDRRAVLQPVSETELNNGKVELRVKMCGLYKSNEDSMSDEDDHHDDPVNHRISRLSKLRIFLCQEVQQGQLQRVSSIVHTDCIEDSKGAEELTIDASSVSPQELCQCGNELIQVRLNTNSEKEGFVVKLNDTTLENHQFRGVHNKTIEFNSIPRLFAGDGSLHLVVSKQSIRETIELGFDPHMVLAGKVLLDTHLPYAELSNNPHDHRA